MTVRQSFSSHVKSGQFWRWIAQLSKEDQQQFWQADERQKQYRQQAIDRGDMTIDHVTGDYIWKDQETAIRNKLHDPVWVDYYHRWMKEANITEIFVLEGIPMLTVYTKSRCSDCINVKNYLKNSSVYFEEKNIEEDQEAMDFVTSQGHRSVPQIYIRGKLFVQGGWSGLSKMTTQEILDEIELRDCLADQTL